MKRSGLIVYGIAWILLRAWATLYFRMQVPGSRNLPKKGPVVVISNHVSHLDPALLGCSFLQRPMCFLAKKELWNGKFLNWFLTSIEAIPVARSAQEDRRTFMTAVKRLKAGHAVLLFPEGTRSKTGEMQNFVPGAAAIACSTPGTTILPVRIKGSYEAMPPDAKLPRPKKIRIVVGKPFKVDDLEGLPEEKKSLYRALTAVMFDRISSL